MTGPLISVVIPNFNGARYLREAMLSVVGQQYPAKEILVIDGGSSDESVGIIKDYTDELDFWISEEDRGQAEAINKGLRMCRGEYVNWLNSDDLLVPAALELVGVGIQEDPEADFIYGDTEVILEDGQHLQHRPEISPSRFVLRYGGNLFAQPSCFFRRSLAKEMGCLDESLHWSMDYDFWLRALARNAKFHQVKGTISRFRLHRTSKTGAQHAKIREQHYCCYSRLTQNRVLRSRGAYRSLKFLARLYRVMRLYRERGIWQPGQYSRALRRLN